MKRWYGALLGLILLMPSTVWGAEVVCTGGGDTALSVTAFDINPTAAVEINGERTDLSNCIRQVGKLLQLDASFFSPVATGTITATMDSDPFISFGATTTNLVAGPTTFGFLFGIPIVPGLYSSATSTGGVSVTNGTSGTSTVATSAIYPTYISGYGTVGFVPTNLGVDLGVAPCVATGVPFTVTTVCAQGTTGSSFAPTFYDNLEALLTYTQDDIASVASWTGAVTLTAAVPEPASLALVAMGALLIGAGKYFRRRQD